LGYYVTAKRIKQTEIQTRFQSYPSRRTYLDIYDHSLQT